MNSKIIFFNLIQFIANLRIVFKLTIFLGIVFLFTILYLAKKEKIDRDIFIILLVFPIGYIYFSLQPSVFRSLAELLGFSLSYTFTFLVSILYLFLLTIYSLIKISKIKKRNLALAEEISILKNKVNSLENSDE